MARKPSDYPQFAFRISQVEKAELTQLIDEVTELYNSNLNPGDYAIRKNDIILEALNIGLRVMQKKGGHNFPKRN